MGSGFAKKKKEAKMLQQQFQQMQEKLKDEKVTGSAGNGLVTVTLSGEHALLDIKIQPACIDPEDPEGLQDLIRAAHQDASRKLNKDTSGLNFPGMPSLGL